MARPPTRINFTDMRHALGPPENCLERLCLDVHQGYHLSRVGGNFHGPMTSFINFKSPQGLYYRSALFCNDRQRDRAR